MIIQDYNLIHNVETEYVNSSSSPNNIDSVNNPGATDPQFVDPGFNNSLQQISPAIDRAAEPVVYAGIPTIDILGNVRSSDIGAYEFVPVEAGSPLLPQPAPAVLEPECIEPSRDHVDFWDYLTSFWDYLGDQDREMFENYWDGIIDTSDHLVKQASRFFESIDPENARTCVNDEYYDIKIGPLYSKPLNLDPTVKKPIYTIRPLGIKLIEPNYIGDQPVYRDLLELAKPDYDRIRNVGLGAYVVINPKNKDIETKYFKIFNLLSSEEPVDKYSYAEIDENQNAGGEDPEIGRIAIQATQNNVEEFKVHVLVSGSGGSDPTSVTWDSTPGSESLVIEVQTGDGISDIFAALPGSGTPWATLINKSGFGQNKAPIFEGSTPLDFGALEIDELSNFIYEESANNRFYPPSGLVWKWFENRPQTGDVIGDTTKGEYVQSQSKFKYIAVVDGDLSYLQDEPFTIHLTTGRSYDIHNYILKIDEIQSFISGDSVAEFRIDRDFSFINSIVEFYEDFFETGEYSNGDYLYVKKAKRIEDYLFQIYGTLVNNYNWKNYNYNNYSGKAAIGALMKSIQDSSNRKNYETALNVYYGLPIAPENSEVIGLYESYGYEVVYKDGNQIRILLQSGEVLHNFVQNQTRFMIEQKKDVKANVVISRLSDFGGISVADLNMDDASDIEIGDLLHTKLRNKFYIKRIIAQDYDSPGDPAYIEIFSPEGAGAIKHVIDTVSALSSGQIYPEIVLYGTEKLATNYNGIYHITDAVEINSIISRLTIYRASGTEDPIYNDYIGVTTPADPAINIKAGFVHMPWPTHKFLYILMNGKNYYRAYLDSPIDTIYDETDVLSKYQVIARNVSTLNENYFPNWYQFDRFKKYNGLDLSSSVLELTKTIPGAVFGEYFPSRFQ